MIKQLNTYEASCDVEYCDTKQQFQSLTPGSLPPLWKIRNMWETGAATEIELICPNCVALAGQ
jgi:hypothetical protein